MHKAIRAVVAGLALLAAGGCEFFEKPTSQVFQGVCISLDNDGKALVLENTEPTSNRIEGGRAVFDLTEARVGLTPEPGDIIRVAYQEEDGVYRAVKVMNVSKQDLRQQ